MTLSDEDIRTAIAEQAGEWLIANQAGPLAEAQGAAFLAWLKASPIHVREYLGVVQVARALPAAMGEARVPLETFLAKVAESNANSVAPMPGRLPRRRRWMLPPMTPLAATIAASLMALVIGTLWWTHDGELFGFPRTYRTAHGEQRIQRLPDGSVLHLDTDSEVLVRYSAAERLIELTRGQALFDVAHEDGRRFRVSAGIAGAVAVGTQFDIYRKGQATEFIVAQGEIAVFAGEPPWLRSARAIPVGVQRVTAGYGLHVDGRESPNHPARVDLSQALGWVRHAIVFEHRPLGDVAAEFNRYGRIPVEIEDAELQSLPISGNFDADETESFVAFLRTLPGVLVETTPARIRVTKNTRTT